MKRSWVQVISFPLEKSGLMAWLPGYFGQEAA
jgi:hypothetical protein